MANFWEIVRYQVCDKARWESFIATARNVTFLFSREYMDYHSDRFADHSLMAYKNGRLAALLPAHLDGDVLVSHGGLSYGGWILQPSHTDCGDVADLFEALALYCRRCNIRAVDYKPLPAIYAKAPSDEDLYALWRMGAVNTECSVSAAVDLRANPGLNQMQRRHLRSSSGLNIEVARADSDEEYAEFHAMLTSCLAERHGTAPIHTLDEMLLLARRFPFGKNLPLGDISLWAVRIDGVMQAGVWVFNTPVTVHAQYIASTPTGRQKNLLTPLFSRLIGITSDPASFAENFGPGKRFFDFGISTEDHGRELNRGLYRQKASYGATASLTTRFLLSI